MRRPFANDGDLGTPVYPESILPGHETEKRVISIKLDVLISNCLIRFPRPFVYI